VSHALGGRSFADWLSLLFLVACWGSTFALTKTALESMTPLWIVSLRLCIGVIAVMAVLRLRRERLPRRPVLWAWLAVIGSLAVVPFFLISWGSQHIDTGLSGILFGIGPLVTIAIAHFVVPGERMTLFKLSGLVVGFCGLVVLIGPGALAGLGGGDLELLAQFAMVGAAAGYSVQGICAKLMPDLSPIQKSAGAFLCAAIISIPLAWTMEADLPLGASWRSLAATAAMGVFATALAGTVMFRLIHSAGPTFLSLTHYLIPLYVLVLGVVLLGEETSARELLALALVVSGIALSEWRGHARQARLASNENRRL